ncbi:MAG: hypothetical protein WCS52_07610 [bacterium]
MSINTYGDYVARKYAVDQFAMGKECNGGIPSRRPRIAFETTFFSIVIIRSN